MDFNKGSGVQSKIGNIRMTVMAGPHWDSGLKENIYTLDDNGTVRLASEASIELAKPEPPQPIPVDEYRAMAKDAFEVGDLDEYQRVANLLIQDAYRWLCDNHLQLNAIQGEQS